MQKCREHIFSFLPKSSSLLIEKINRKIFFSCHHEILFFVCLFLPFVNIYCFILHLVRSSYGEVEPLNLELDSVNQFSFLFFLFYILYFCSQMYIYALIWERVKEGWMEDRKKYCSMTLNLFIFLLFFPISILIQFLCSVLLFFLKNLLYVRNSIQVPNLFWIFRDYPDLWQFFLLLLG